MTYSLNEELAKDLKDVPSVYPVFRYPFFHDVTATYLGQQNGQIVIPQKELYDCPRTGELQTNKNGFLSLVLFLTGRLFVLIMWKEG